MRFAYVYILTNLTRTVLYVGVTSNLVRRIGQHRMNEKQDSFTAKYGSTILVCYEIYSSVVEAIAREKQLKGWNRQKKEDLINQANPEWNEIEV